ncbi:hypothetical protein [Pleomorphomonas carboxyditropha]|uniref:Uncharacterized protein n=1 Tax=Pleomorphomonas carboxyditropha TaxID=2023338 RepID=A0A2G9X160_9HYPH|nr:hypothetical protein [Pleomorphomonas carboxyditropha]PIP00670.1 hypothetical protein CJ014_00775 [Pleomorphomonas carboxyditropha]
MASRLYRYWTDDELKEAIRALEEAKMSGAQSVACSNGQSVTYIARANMNNVLAELYDVLDDRLGITTSKPIRRIQLIYGPKGYRS